MKKLVFITMLLMIVFSCVAQNRTMRGNLTIEGGLEVGTISPSGDELYIDTSMYVKGSIQSEHFKKAYPSAPLIMENYPVEDKNGVTRFSPYYSGGVYNVDPDLGTQSFLNFTFDSIYIVDTTNRVFTVDQSTIILDTPDSVSLYSITRFDSDFRYVGNYVNPGRNITGNSYYFLLFPDAEDTVQAEYIHGDDLHLQIGSDGRVDLKEATLQNINLQLGASASIDSINMIRIASDDEGYVGDSIGKYFGIKHSWDDSPLQKVVGTDATYFLYSEYGDNYLNGDLEVTENASVGDTLKVDTISPSGDQLYIDTSVYVNGDLDVVGNVTGRDTYILPDSINMDDYERAEDNRRYFNLYTGNSDIYPSSSGNNYLNFYKDTIRLHEGTNFFTHNGWDVDIATINTFNKWIRMSNQNITVKDNFKLSNDLVGWYKDIFLAPDDNDTVSFLSAKGEVLLLRAYTGFGSSNYIDLNEMVGMEIQGSVDNDVTVDSVTMIRLWPYDNGIDPDSISKYYGIYHGTPSGAGKLEGSDKTYFLYSEYGDNYLNGDLDVHGRLMDYPYGSIDMADYNHGAVDSWKYREGTLDVTPSTGIPIFEYFRDTINYLTSDDQPLRFSYDYKYIPSFETTAGTGSSIDFDAVFVNNFDANGGASSFINKKYALNYDPQSGDTVQQLYSTNLWLENNYTTDFSDGIVDIDIDRNLYLYKRYFDEVVVDKSIALDIYQYQGGSASVNDVYGIYNNDGGLHGSDATYFLYSEYGDNYLNGELEVTGGIKQTQLSASLTDGTPTDAEIDSATGLTPATAGAGYKVSISDSDGSGLLYRIESDGTDWFYTVMTKAL